MRMKCKCQKCEKEFESTYKREMCYECKKPYEQLKTKQDVETGVKKCSKCQEIKPLHEFYKLGNINKSTGEQYLAGHCKACARTTQSDYFKSLKQKCIKYKGGKCQTCGYSKCTASLDFHHRVLSDKDFNISEKRRNFETIQKELDKCDLLCSNCHRELHYTLETFKTVSKS